MDDFACHDLKETFSQVCESRFGRSLALTHVGPRSFAGSAGDLEADANKLGGRNCP